MITTQSNKPIHLITNDDVLCVLPKSMAVYACLDRHIQYIWDVYPLKRPIWFAFIKYSWWICVANWMSENILWYSVNFDIWKHSTSIICKMTLLFLDAFTGDRFISKLTLYLYSGRRQTSRKYWIRNIYPRHIVMKARYMLSRKCPQKLYNF